MSTMTVYNWLHYVAVAVPVKSNRRRSSYVVAVSCS